MARRDPGDEFISGEAEELLFIRNKLIQPTAPCPHPDRPLSILENRPDGVASKAPRIIIKDKSEIGDFLRCWIPPVQPAFLRSCPEESLAVRKQVPYGPGVRVQWNPVEGLRLPVETVEPMEARADPQASALVLLDREDRVAAYARRVVRLVPVLDESFLVLVEPE